MDLLSGALAACLHGGLPSPDHDDIVAKAQEPFHYRVAYGFAIAEQKDYGHQSPNNAKHRQSRAQAIASQRLDGLGKGFTQIHRKAPWLVSAEALDRCKVRGPQSRIGACGHRDNCKRDERRDNRSR
jgi:hypothetical protein